MYVCMHVLRIKQPTQQSPGSKEQLITTIFTDHLGSVYRNTAYSMDQVVLVNITIYRWQHWSHYITILILEFT